jgi:hypothetical protein
MSGSNSEGFGLRKKVWFWNLISECQVALCLFAELLLCGETAVIGCSVAMNGKNFDPVVLIAAFFVVIIPLAFVAFWFTPRIVLGPIAGKIKQFRKLEQVISRDLSIPETLPKRYKMLDIQADPETQLDSIVIEDKATNYVLRFEVLPDLAKTLSSREVLAQSIKSGKPLAFDSFVAKSENVLDIAGSRMECSLGQLSWAGKEYPGLLGVVAKGGKHHFLLVSVRSQEANVSAPNRGLEVLQQFAPLISSFGR